MNPNATPAHPPSHLFARPLSATLLVFALLTFNPKAHPQGCTQCRDNTAATPHSTQSAYRRAITLLAVTAGGIFVGTVLLLRRQR